MTLETDVRRLLIEANLPVSAETAIRLIAKAVEDHLASCQDDPPGPRPLRPASEQPRFARPLKAGGEQ